MNPTGWVWCSFVGGDRVAQRQIAVVVSNDAPVMADVAGGDLEG
jgi:hypothetical protein